MIGPEFATFCEEVNGGVSIGDTLLFQLLNLSKAMVEQRRAWVLRRQTFARFGFPIAAAAITDGASFECLR